MTADAAPINPSMLRWARQSAGYSVEDVAKRLGVRTELVTKWEAGEAPVSYRRADALSTFFRRPSAILYLREPPQEDGGLPPDYRAESPSPTPGIILQVRRAKERREVALELVEELDETPEPFGLELDRDEDPEVAGAALRAFLHVEESLDNWSKDIQGYQALGARRFAAERAGALVFQAPESEIGDASGLSLYFETLPIVVLRASDNPRRRSFTLMHELAHLGLRAGGLCDMHDEGDELFCNQVAAAALIAPEALRGEIRRQGTSRDVTPQELVRLARAFSVSEQAMMLRLVALERVSLEAYKQRRSEFALRVGGGESEGGGVHHQVVIARNGERFSRLVMDAYYQGVITMHRAAKTLEASPGSLEQVAEEIAKKSMRRAS